MSPIRRRGGENGFVDVCTEHAQVKHLDCVQRDTGFCCSLAGEGGEKKKEMFAVMYLDLATRPTRRHLLVSVFFWRHHLFSVVIVITAVATLTTHTSEPPCPPHVVFGG